MGISNIKTLIFRAGSETDAPHCYKKGIGGVTKIKAIKVPTEEDIPSFYYEVYFKDKSKEEIYTTIYAE